MNLSGSIKQLAVHQVDEDDVPLEDTIATLSYEDFEPEAALNGDGPDEDLEDTEADLDVIEEGNGS